MISPCDSYFDIISSHKVWKIYETGYRARILSELKEIRSNYEHYLTQELDQSSVLYQVAYQSLLFSTSWIEDFVRYIDEVFEEYTESKFDPRRAWNVTTRLAMALLEDIAVPRTGVKSAMQNKNRIQMKEITFYSSILSLDKMTAIYKAGFKNSPVVTNELVKVLAKNTQVVIIECLRTEVSNMADGFRDIKVKTIEAKQLANAANNKSDAVTSDIDRIGKRMQKLEQRKGKGKGKDGESENL